MKMKIRMEVTDVKTDCLRYEVVHLHPLVAPYQYPDYFCIYSSNPDEFGKFERGDVVTLSITKE